MKTAINKKTNEKNICTDCFNEEYIKSTLISKNISKCDYCNKKNHVVNITKFADYVENAINQFYKITPNKPDILFQILKKHGGGQKKWIREGTNIGNIINKITGTKKYQAKNDIRKILEQKNIPSKSNTENPFSLRAKYIEVEANDEEFCNKWMKLENKLIVDSRYFCDYAKDTLDEIFENIDNINDNTENPLFIYLGPDQKNSVLFRSRKYVTRKSLEESFKQPEKNLGPPPTKLATAGRINPHGISTFYGATNKEVSIAEVRPPVGSRVIVAKFNLLRNLKILNIGRFESIYMKGSKLDPENQKLSQNARFLKRLCYLFSKPVLPDDENSEYIITQVISDYLSSNKKLTLDGLMYPSSQYNNLNENIVLFHKSSKVRFRKVFEKYETEVKIHNWENSLFDQSYNKKYGIYRKGEYNYLNQENSSEDLRVPTLELDLFELNVVHIDSVDFSKQKVHNVFVDPYLFLFE